LGFNVERENYWSTPISTTKTVIFGINKLYLIIRVSIRYYLVFKLLKKVDVISRNFGVLDKFSIFKSYFRLLEEINPSSSSIHS
jgi:hypothetical protein